MPKKKTLWKRETPCLVCETPMINYQFMTKSQLIVLDDWMVPHYKPVSYYEEYPETVKTTICPNCLSASNEYSYGVDQYRYFNRNPRRNEQIAEFFQTRTQERFQVLREEISHFEEECAFFDQQNKRPANTRTRATFDKIWSNKEQYGIPFFKVILDEPRDLITALACFAVDRYCQYLRIAFNYDVAPSKWDYTSLQEAVTERFQKEPLSLKSTDPRFYFIGINYIQSIQFLKQVNEIVHPENPEAHQEIIEQFWNHAYTVIQLCMENDDISAVPNELKDGGMHLLMAKLHFHFQNEEAGKKNLRYAKNYADNRLKKISSQNQQMFVNLVDDLYKEHFEEQKPVQT